MSKHVKGKKHVDDDPKIKKLNVDYNMSALQSFVNSLPGQFIIGGLTVSGITGFSNHLNNPALAGIIASVPIGMPSSVL